MNYHNILHDDMRNGDGLRVTLFVSGCNHYCNKCHNPSTWDINSGIEFGIDEENEIFKQLSYTYTDGITFTGGDPLNENNVDYVLKIANQIRILFPEKTIWLYTGYTWEECLSDEKRLKIVSLCDVVVDGEYIDELRDISLKWRGSHNQRVIDAKKSLEINDIVLYCN